MATSYDFREALKLCSETSETEYSHADLALERVKSVLQSLQKETDAIVARTAVQPGTATSAARSRLTELTRLLHAETTDSVDTVRESLTRKKARLSKFTVTLFGRTMVGKSTIREAVTRGDGETIGKGAQRTTRDIREYEWNQLRIIDTPGIGAFDGAADRDLALSVIDESDVLLFLVSSDGIQESSFCGMRQLRNQNKPMVFVLNVKLDLTQPIYMRRFIRCPEAYLGGEAIRGHVSRIRKLAVDELGMRRPTIIPIHAQAAYFATRQKYAMSADTLHRSSGIDALVRALTFDVKRRGPVRRIRTILDGTIVKLTDVEEMLGEQAKLVNRAAKDLKAKFSDVEAWLDDYLRGLDARIARRTSELIRPLRDSVSSFVDENIEQKDVRARWHNRVNKAGIELAIRRALEQVLDEVRGRLEVFNREITFDFGIGREFEPVGPEQYDPFDIKRTLRWTSAVGTALVGVFAVAGLLNPMGWIPLGVTVAPYVFSWFFRDREKKLQRRKATVAKELRRQIDKMELQIAQDMREWCNKNIDRRLGRGVRHSTRKLYHGMFGLARAIWAAADSCSKELETLNRRLVERCGILVGCPPGDTIDAIVRDPGVRAKLSWASSSAGDRSFCREVGKALDEWIDGIVQGPKRQMVACALTPAEVSAQKVYFDSARTRAIVPLPQSEIGRAIGKHGNNVRLASRLLRIRVQVVDQRRWGGSTSTRTGT